MILSLHSMILSHDITWYYHTVLHDIITLCHTTSSLTYHCGVIFSYNKWQIIRKLWWQAQLATHLLSRNLTSNRNKCGCINQCIITPSLILTPQHSSFYIKLLPSLSCSSPQLLPLLILYTYLHNQYWRFGERQLVKFVRISRFQVKRVQWSILHTNTCVWLYMSHTHTHTHTYTHPHTHTQHTHTHAHTQHTHTHTPLLAPISLQAVSSEQQPEHTHGKHGGQRHPQEDSSQL